MILPGLIERLGLTSGLKSREVVTLWPRVVGVPISRKTEAQDIEAGVLVVNVRESAWMQELYFLKPDIIKKLNRELGETIVKDIKFRLRS